MNLVSIVLLMAATTPTKGHRINLVDSAQVVRYEGDSPATLPAHPLERGPDGYDAWVGPDGQYMIGVEWDAPRDLAEVNIEFRHAIANREGIRVQYWQEDWPVHDGQKTSRPAHGRWTTAKADWWAGDRDVTFSFVPYHQEQPGKDAPDFRYRRTRRLRFLLGKKELPPVRYLKAYGPTVALEATFALSFDAGSTVRPPVRLSIIN